MIAVAVVCQSPDCAERYASRRHAGAGLVDAAKAEGWSVAPRGWPDHTPEELVGMCPGCQPVRVVAGAV